MHDVKQLVKCGLYTGLNLFLYFPFFGQVNSFLSVIWEGGPQNFADNQKWMNRWRLHDANAKQKVNSSVFKERKKRD